MKIKSTMALKGTSNHKKVTHKSILHWQRPKAYMKNEHTFALEKTTNRKNDTENHSALAKKRPKSTHKKKHAHDFSRTRNHEAVRVEIEAYMQSTRLPALQYSCCEVQKLTHLSHYIPASIWVCRTLLSWTPQKEKESFFRQWVFSLRSRKRLWGRWPFPRAVYVCECMCMYVGSVCEGDDHSPELCMYVSVCVRM